MEKVYIATAVSWVLAFVVFLVVTSQQAKYTNKIVVVGSFLYATGFALMVCFCLTFIVSFGG